MNHDDEDKHNEHVIEYLKVLLDISTKNHMQLAMVFYYTQMMLEIDPKWKPYAVYDLKTKLH